MKKQETKKGLKNIVALESNISSVDGKKGILTYNGYNIKDLAKHSNFEEVIYLLWHKKLPTKTEFEKLDKKLKQNRKLSISILKLIKSFPKQATPMEVLRTVVSALSLYDPETNDNSKKANLNKAIKLTAKLPSIISAFERIKNNKKPISPKNELSHAGNFLYMLTGKKPDKFSEKIFDMCLILHADHSLNASTFSARITTSTLSDMYSAVTSAIGTLKGSLHGGANEKVMRMLFEIKDISNVENYIKEKLSKKEKIFGFGHRVYKVKDPRADILEKHLPELAKIISEPKWYEISKKIEKTVEKELKGKSIHANVDFYSATTYYSLGIPPELFTPIFALSRITGWTAHILEQYDDNTLIRPLSKYIGPKNLKYIPIEKRN